MKASSFDSRRKANLARTVLAVAVIVSALLAVALIYMAQMRPHF